MMNLLDRAAMNGSGQTPHKRATSTNFVRNGNHYQIVPTTDQVDKLPVAVYSLGFDPMQGCFFLEVGDSFSRPGKLYGDALVMSERILSTYLHRNRNTGILLQGEKGSGKSMIARLVSVSGAEQGIPTILINAPFAGEAFNEFLSEISTRAIVIFDEFEKIYDRDTQVRLLSLLDGMRPSNKLFIFTANEYSGIDYHLENRPGRIFYSITFSGLEQSFIKEYLQDKLADQTRVEEVMRVCSVIGKVNFDMLAAIVEEMNRYNESAKTALKYMNIRLEGTVQYTVHLTVDGKKIIDISPNAATNPLIKDEDGDESGLTVVDNTEYHKWDFALSADPANMDLRKKPPHREIYLFKPEHFVSSRNGDFDFYIPETKAKVTLSRISTYSRSTWSYL